MPGYRCARGIWVAFSLALCIGCSESAPTYDTTTDEGLINTLFADMGDLSNSQYLAEQNFVPASIPKPAERAKYGKYAYQVVEKTFEGDTANLKVKITTIGTTTETEKEWTAVKAGGQWKLQDAPLP